MPFKLRLVKRSQQYNVTSKESFVVPVLALDHSNVECTLLSTSLGIECLHTACQRLGLLQPDVFGLLFASKRNCTQWLDLDKPVKKQLDKMAIESKLYIRVQFFLPDPCIISDEVTRNHYFLQLRHQVIEGRVKVSQEEAIMLAGYNLQIEFGDYNPRNHTTRFVSELTLLPRTMVSSENMKNILYECIIKAYKGLQGLSASEAKVLYVRECQKYEGFGLEGFPAKDSENGDEVCLGISLHGIFLIRNYQVENFRWNDIANLIHQKKIFTIELNPNGQRKNFIMMDGDYARFTWRVSVEQHQYFMKGGNKLLRVETPPRNGNTWGNHVSHHTLILGNNHDNHQTSFTQLNHATNTVNTIDQNHNSSQLNTNYNSSQPNFIVKANLPVHHSLPNVATNIVDSRDAVDSGIKVDNTLLDLQKIHFNLSNTNLHENDSLSQRPITNSSGNVCINPNGNTNGITMSSVTNPSPGNVAAVQIHKVQEAPWITLNQVDHAEDMPPYKAPPDYESYIQSKCNVHSLSVGNLPSYVSNYHIVGPVTNTAIGRSYSQYQNYTDLSKIETDSSFRDETKKESAPVVSRNNAVCANHPVTNSTPELNSLSNIVNKEVRLQTNVHLIRYNPYPCFNSVPNLSEQIAVKGTHQQFHLQQQNERRTHNNMNCIRSPGGSEPNLPQSPLKPSAGPSGRHLSFDELNISQGRNDLKDSVHSEKMAIVYTVSENGGNSTSYRVSSNYPSAHVITSSGCNEGISSIKLPSSLALENKDDKMASLCEIASIKDPRLIALETIIASQEFAKEFDFLPRMNPKAKFETALLPENIYRNRFRDILPYEENRIRITPTRENRSGYINASRIIMQAATMRQHYIAAQGPLSHTAIDFWQMVKENSINLIVMVTDLIEGNQEKCFPYYPSSSEPGRNIARFGDYELQCNFTLVSHTYITSSITLRHNGSSQTIYHVRYTDWPDHSCPQDVQGFLSFLEGIDAICRLNAKDGGGSLLRKKSDPYSVAAPMLVHCSAGAGRSGVVIICDFLLRSLDYNSEIDVPKVLTQLRFQRMLSVQNLDQYRFIHNVLIQYLKFSRLI